MSRSLRYTGQWPPPEVLKQFRNWQYALDEEGEEGQDETTIRPIEEQRIITSETDFTTAIATERNGTVRRAIIGINFGEVDSVNVFTDNESCWGIINMPTGWEPVWLPEEKRANGVSLDNADVFPLHVISDLPDVNGKRIEFVVEPR
jgi:hypothetical protein